MGKIGRFVNFTCQSIKVTEIKSRIRNSQDFIVTLGVRNAGWEPGSRETSQTQINSRISKSGCNAGM